MNENQVLRTAMQNLAQPRFFPPLSSAVKRYIGRRRYRETSAAAAAKCFRVKNFAAVSEKEEKFRPTLPSLLLSPPLFRSRLLFIPSAVYVPS